MKKEDKKSGSKLRLDSLDKKCLFHRKEGETFDMESLTPEGMCQKAFYTSYPYYLGLMYDAWENVARTGITFKCSGDECSAVWLIRTEPWFFAPIIKIFETILRTLGRHLDFPERAIVMRLLSIEGKCDMNHSVGSEFKSDLPLLLLGKKAFCPQSFYIFYPYLSESGNVFMTPWNNKKMGCSVSCPAIDQSATYKISDSNILGKNL